MLTSRRWRGALAAALLATTALGGYAVLHHARAAAPATNVAVSAALPDFSGLVTKVKPAVVSITVKLKAQDVADQMPGIPTPFGMLRPVPPPGQAIEARGSGFIVDAKGIVVTNNHVVEHARSVTVTLDDGTELPATIIGRDPRTDIAVLRVKPAHDLPWLQLGDSNNVLPGQWVVAMGNPFGLGGTVTAGIVSARGRDIGSGPYDDFIQVDAPINKGNSGGPLFTQDGRVVGINTAILSPTGGSVGIGFAIPTDMVKTVVAQIEKNGHVVRGYLGVESQAIDQNLAEALHLPKTDKPDANGALVASVRPDSPAAKAGIEAGDVIRSVNGQTIANPRDLAIDIASVKPGDTAKIDLLRNGATKTFDVAVATLPSTHLAANDGHAAPARHNVGLALQALTPQLRDQLSLSPDVKGVVVAGVENGSPADQAGIQQGDVIVGVGSHMVTTPAEAKAAIQAQEKDSRALALRILRDGHTGFVALNLDRKPGQQNG
jgi:serine protease Do